MRISVLLKVLGVVFAGLAIVLIFSVLMLRSHYLDVQKAVSRQAEFKQLGFDLERASNYLTDEARKYVQFGNKTFYNNYWREVNETKSRDRVVERLKEMNAPQQELDLLTQAKMKSDALVQTEEAAFRAAEAGNFDQARQLMFDDAYERNKQIIAEPISRFQTLMNSRAEQELRAAEDGFHTFLYITIAAIVLAVAAMMTSIGLLFVKLKPLQTIVGKLQELANNEGDLTSRLPETSKDEIGELSRSFNKMLASYQEFVRNIISSAQHVGAAAVQISATTEEVAGGTQSQAQFAQQINELFRELNLSMESISKNAVDAADFSEKMSAMAQEGGTIIDNTIRGITRLNEQIEVLEKDSEKVGEIVAVIDEIAEQTNLLALNAAIEAARAGDQGRGFAVVADEVRKLAERSGNATKEISAIIKGMQSNMKDSVRATSKAVEDTDKTGEAFDGIVGMVKQTSSRIMEIAAATEEQTAQSATILESVEMIAASCEQSAAASQETAGSAQSLAGLAEELNRSVSAFQV